MAKCKLQCGTRVICILGDGTVTRGALGTVIGRPSREPDSTMIAVEWDEHHARMHAFEDTLRPTPRPMRKILPGHGWYVYPKMIERYDDVGPDHDDFGVTSIHYNREE